MVLDNDFRYQFQARGLAGARGERWLFDGLDLDLAPGDALVVTGPNGTGKTTLLRILAGLLAAAEGRVDWKPAPPDDTVRLHYLGHHNSVKGALTVAANLAFWQRLAGGGDAAALERASTQFAIADLLDLPARVLSAGQKRRLALARLVAIPAPLWLLDEPTTALDAASTDAFARAVEAHRAMGGMAVIATHQDLGFAPTHRLRLGEAG
ncbi:MAG: heme ABC exporter ATP-binding protein CcmA [Alphaproteobacteria bacterium]|nr:heme ABC exporter ATP-binding protein CcmA [Alphaproteobacteria bacterium]MCB9930665.1 heme ABC exporter ATP-binding protein CcmA [Alphaproteobacteria bacterium]